MTTKTFKSIRDTIDENKMLSYFPPFRYPHEDGGRKTMFSSKNPLTEMIWKNCIKKIIKLSKNERRKLHLQKIIQIAVPQKTFPKSKHYELAQNVLANSDILSVIKSFHRNPITTQDLNKSINILDALLFSFYFLKCIMINVDLMFHFYWLIRTSAKPTTRDKFWTYTTNMSDTAQAFEAIYDSMEGMKYFAELIREKAIEIESGLGIPGKGSKNLMIEPYWSIKPDKKRQQLLKKKNRERLVFPFQNYSEYKNSAQEQKFKFPQQNYKPFYQELAKETPRLPYNLSKLLSQSTTKFQSQQQLRQQRQKLQQVQQERQIHFKYIDSMFFMLIEQTMGLCEIFEDLLDFLDKNGIIFEDIEYINVKGRCQYLLISTPDLDFCNSIQDHD